MKLRLTSLVMLVAMMSTLLLLPARATAAQEISATGPLTNIPLNGAVSGGTLSITKFVVQNGALFAQGTVRSAGGGMLGNFTAPVALAQGTAATCTILTLTLGPLDLNLLGLEIHLNQVVLTITAQTGPGNLLGNLLCAIANLLNGGGALTDIANLLNAVLGVLRYSASNPLTNIATTGTVAGGTLSITKFLDQNGTLAASGILKNGSGATVAGFTTPVTATPGSTCTILDLTLGPLDLNLLGLRIQTNQINLTITAQQGPGNLLGNLLCAVANLLNGGGALADIVRLLNLILLIAR